MESKCGKQYGLIIAKKKQPNQMTSKPSIFGNNSDSDAEENIGKIIKKESLKKLSRKQTQLEMKRALDEDPTVYEYDSIYDNLKEQKETKKSETAIDRKPKYIEALLKTADKRKKDYERRVERKIQLEREEEGEKFADKEAFVTSAYKKKMQELQEEEEKEKRMDVIEAMMDVTKQKDLSGFYRHLLKRETDGSEGASVSAETQVKEEIVSGNESSHSDHEKQDPKSKAIGSSKESLPCRSKESSLESTPSTSLSALATEGKAREAISTLRNRHSDKDNVAEADNVDADSDFSIDSETSSSDSSDHEDDDSKAECDNSSVRPKSGKKRRGSTSPDSAVSKKKSCPEVATVNENGSENAEQVEKEAIKEKFASLDEDSKSGDSEHEVEKPVLSTQEKLKLLFSKRTVGEVFESARERYLQRREALSAARLAFASVPVK